ncbi:Phage Mu protein F like protein [Paraburkholderia tuberum]|uniref:Phage Mu protein F like protein n=2 Tax=Paraburkholderia tuberum TaxID=157910 RepID=A0A1H1GW91_9BURK|nr:Phage Mu protein F like protein [Paraburkholderia tuberum]
MELRTIRPNAGVSAQYQKQLDKWVAAMHRSLIYWIAAQYRANPPPTLAHDAATGAYRDGSSATAMRRMLDRLAGQWASEFETAAARLARYFVDRAASTTDMQMRDALKGAGFSVQFKATAGVNNAMQTAIGENVGLIRSIAEQHLSNVQGIVMRGMQQGRDLSYITDELTERYGVTRRRAAFIARDQANKATGAIKNARALELGITQERWRHSGAGKHPRQSHVEASRDDGGKGRLFDVAKGCLIDGKYIWPGSEPGCRCTGKLVIPGFN